jgi:hypothetical protein
MKKLSSIQHEEKINIEFEDKYDAFVEAMHFESSNIQNTKDEEF